MFTPKTSSSLKRSKKFSTWFKRKKHVMHAFIVLQQTFFFLPGPRTFLSTMFGTFFSRVCLCSMLITNFIIVSTFAHNIIPICYEWPYKWPVLIIIYNMTTVNRVIIPSL
uniref:Uncharacterized protein n=1 Tax=Cacopsylla melanoneura TaxID=428564 RepID=A0A8D9EUA9_9HEMI